MKFEIFVDGVSHGIIDTSSREEALEKVADWNGLSVVEV
jgi:hypothetical protein